jgi:hypothetical protein
MDWRDIAGDLVKAGAPIIGTAVGGPLGGIAGNVIGKLIADALGVAPTPDAVSNAINTLPASEVQAKLAEADARWSSIAAQVQAEAELGSAQVAAIGETMRAELQLAGLVSGRARTLIAVLQGIWRPYIMLVWGTSLPFQLAAILHKAYAKDAGTLAELSSVLTALAMWNAGPAGVAGVYAWGRTREKLADLVPLPPVAGNAVRDVIKAVRR